MEASWARAGYEGVFIVGAGQTAYEKRSTKPVHRLLWEATDAGLRSAGLNLKRLDGLAVTSFCLPPDNVTVLAEHFGIEPRWLFQGLYGGASGIISMLHAARAIQAGDAEVIACVTGDVFDVAAHMELIDRFNTPMRDFQGSTSPCSAMGRLSATAGRMGRGVSMLGNGSGGRRRRRRWVFAVGLCSVGIRA